jgi:Ala-tRNA(Pro) deacylase
MNVQTFLQQKRIAFAALKHAPTFTAQELAATEHVTGNRVAKVVVATAGGKFYMLVLPASHNVRFDRLARVLGHKDCRLATEEELGKLFPDCEVGAMPPFGREYGLETYADTHLAEGEEIIFESGHHDEAVKMKWSDYEALEKPKVAEFAEHLH